MQTKGKHSLKLDKDTFSVYKGEIFIQKTMQTHEQTDLQLEQKALYSLNNWFSQLSLLCRWGGCTSTANLATQRRENARVGWMWPMDWLYLICSSGQINEYLSNTVKSNTAVPPLQNLCFYEKCSVRVQWHDASNPSGSIKIWSAALSRWHCYLHHYQG